MYESCCGGQRFPLGRPGFVTRQEIYPPFPSRCLCLLSPMISSHCLALHLLIHLLNQTLPSSCTWLVLNLHISIPVQTTLVSPCIDFFATIRATPSALDSWLQSPRSLGIFNEHLQRGLLPCVSRLYFIVCCLVHHLFPDALLWLSKDLVFVFFGATPRV